MREKENSWLEFEDAVGASSRESCVVFVQLLKRK